MSDSEYGICPYNEQHRILLFRMPGHIVKCVRNYRGPPLAVCKYNATHRLPAEQMDQHFAGCADYIKFHGYKSTQIALQARKSPPRAEV